MDIESTDEPCCDLRSKSYTSQEEREKHMELRYTSMQNNITQPPDSVLYYGLVLAAKLNNLGISLLENLCFDLATELLNHAVKILESRYSPTLQLFMPAKELGFNKNDVSSFIDQDPAVQSALFHLQNVEESSSESNSSHSKTVTLPLGFKRPQTIGIPDIDRLGDDGDCLSSLFDRCSATLLFNLAVTFQVTGYYSSESCKVSLRRNSTYCYNMCWSVIEETDPSHRWHCRLSISLLNNLGFLFCEQGDLDSAYDCFRKLALIIIMDNNRLHFETIISTLGDKQAAAAA